MQKKLKTFFLKNLKSIGLIFLIILTVTIAGYSNKKVIIIKKTKPKIFRFLKNKFLIFILILKYLDLQLLV